VFESAKLMIVVINFSNGIKQILYKELFR